MCHSEEVKICTKCGEEKPLSGFYKRLGGRHKGRIESQCKCCTKKQNSCYRKEHNEEFKSYIKEYYKNNSQVMKRRAAENKISRTKNLSDSYIREVLHHIKGFSRNQITPDLIVAYRALLKAKRAIKETSK